MAWRRYAVSPGGAFGGPLSNEELHLAVGKDALDWVWRGFDVTLLAVGQQSSGKTYSLHGHGDADPASPHAGLVQRAAAELLRRIGERPGGLGRMALCVSAYDVSHAGLLDLLAPAREQGGAGALGVHSSGPHPPASAGRAAALAAGALPLPEPYVTCVEVRSSAELARALAIARARSVNWSAEGAGTGVPCPRANRSHSIVRLCLLDATGRTEGARAQGERAAGWVAQYCFVDTVGAAPAGAAAAAALAAGGAGSGSASGGGGGAGFGPAAPTGASVSSLLYERQMANRSLLALSRTLNALAAAGDGGGGPRAAGWGGYGGGDGFARAHASLGLGAGLETFEVVARDSK